MDPSIYLTFILFLLPFILFLIIRRNPSKKLPPGSLGFPIIGQSLSLLDAMRKNTAEKWFQERVKKYGPISKLSLFGTPTVFIRGPAANKFVYTCSDGRILNCQQPTSIRRIMGERNILELSGDDHKRVRGALVSFLKPDVLKQYVGKMDEEIQMHLQMHWLGKDRVKVEPLMKNLTFNVMTSLLFGIERGARRDTLVKLFNQAVDGILSVPINLPFTRYNRSLQACAKIRKMLRDLVSEKRAAMEQNGAYPNQDLISCLLGIQKQDNSISDEEIVDNAVVVMIAGHDTTSILLTFLIRLLANDPSVYAAILQEQEEIAKSKGPGEVLTWEDLSKMKYTWRVATETLRVTPPILCSFRRVQTDFEYEGYVIPKGWQVIWAACMTHMDEQIFPDPTKFDPSRFEKQTGAPPYSFVAFGGGPRICPGNEFARIETLATLHYLITLFTWKLSSKDDSFSREPLPVFNQGLPIDVVPKKSVKVN